MKNIAVFASGTGSNFLAIYNAINEKKIDAKLSLFVSDRPKSKSVEKAKALHLDSFIFYPKKYTSKEEYELEILEELEKRNVDLIVLAGYMRLIGHTLLHNYEKRIINIHPSLLPSFKGKDAVGQAMNARVKVIGVSIHYVDEGMDTGEIIAQEALDISNLTSREEIETRVHKIEHRLYPKTIQKVLEDLKWEEP